MHSKQKYTINESVIDKKNHTWPVDAFGGGGAPSFLQSAISGANFGLENTDFSFLNILPLQLP